MSREFPNNLVYGYHGTTAAAAVAILREGFIAHPSRGDWLGRGTYFFENDEERSKLWAQERARRERDSAVVIRAVLNLAACLDLTTITYRNLLVQHAELLDSLLPPQELARLKQTWGVREVDALVIEQICAVVRNPDGTPRFTTVRGCFAEGNPAYALGRSSSGINDLDHVQIAVVDATAIEDIELTYL
jgi:hypothetical protein